MAAWHPYPYSAMMGSRSAAEQPGFIANIPSYGGWGGGGTMIGTPGTGKGFGGNQGNLHAGYGVIHGITDPRRQLDPSGGGRNVRFPNLGPPPGWRGGPMGPPTQYPPGFGGGVGGYPIGVPRGEGVGLNQPFYGGGSQYPEQGRPYLGSGQTPGGIANDPFLAWIRQQYGQYYGQQPRGGYPTQAY